MNSLVDWNRSQNSKGFNREYTHSFYLNEVSNQFNPYRYLTEPQFIFGLQIQCNTFIFIWLQHHFGKLSKYSFWKNGRTITLGKIIVEHFYAIRWVKITKDLDKIGSHWKWFECFFSEPKKAFDPESGNIFIWKKLFKLWIVQASIEKSSYFLITILRRKLRSIVPK